MMSSDCHIFFIFCYYIVQEDGEEADRLWEDWKLEISGLVLLETLYWL